MDHVGYLARLHTNCGSGSLTSELPAAPDGTDYVARLWDPVTRDFVRRNGYVREYRFSHPSAGNIDWCAEAAFRDVINARVDGLSTQPHTEDLTFLVRATKPSGALELEALDPPCRLLDTRTPPTTHLRRGELSVFPVAGVASGSCGGRIPAGAKAVALTVTAVQPSHQGHVSVHLPGTDPRATAVVNFMRGETVAGSGHFLLTPLGKLGVSAWATDPAATIPLVIDATGYFVENVKEARQ
jgi:hypothetical protein